MFLNLFEVNIKFVDDQEKLTIDGRETSKDEFINLVVRHSAFFTPWLAPVFQYTLNLILNLKPFYLPRLHRFGKNFVATLGFLLLTYNIILNLRPIKTLGTTTRELVNQFESLDLIKHGLNFEQRWGMFSPAPSRSDGWHIIYGERYNGAKVDLWGTDYRFPLKKPESVAATYRNQRWRKYLDTVVRETHKGYRPYFLQHICYEINKYKKNPLFKLKKGLPPFHGRTYAG